MKSLTSVVAVIVLLTTGAIDAQSAGSSKSSKNARENQITAELNRQQLQGNAQQATSPSTPMATPTGSKAAPRK